MVHSHGSDDYPACALRALGLQTVPSQWGGGRLFDASAKFFYEAAITQERKVGGKIQKEIHEKFTVTVKYPFLFIRPQSEGSERGGFLFQAACNW